MNSEIQCLKVDVAFNSQRVKHNKLMMEINGSDFIVDRSNCLSSTCVGTVACQQC